MLDKLRLTIGRIFESTSNASAAGLSFFLNAADLVSTRLCLLLCVLLRPCFISLTLRLFCSLAFLGCEDFTRTLNGIVRVGETGGILTMQRTVAIISIAANCATTMIALRVNSRAAKRTLPGTIWPGSLYIANPT
jgi:hypothetical protein